MIPLLRSAPLLRHTEFITPSRKRNRRANLVLRYAALFPSPFGVDSAIVSKNVSFYLLVPSHLGSLADWRLSFPFLLPRHPPCTHLDPKYYAMSCASRHTTPPCTSYPSPSRHVNNVSWATTIMPATIHHHRHHHQRVAFDSSSPFFFLLYLGYLLMGTQRSVK